MLLPRVRSQRATPGIVESGLRGFCGTIGFAGAGLTGSERASTTACGAIADDRLAVECADGLEGSENGSECVERDESVETVEMLLAVLALLDEASEDMEAARERLGARRVGLMDGIRDRGETEALCAVISWLHRKEQLLT